MHIIRREEAVADAGRITVHPALVIATEQTIHIEFREVGILLLLQQQILDDALLNADKPRGQGVHHKVQRLVFNVGECGSGQIGYQMRRHTEDAADLRHRKLLRFKELTVLRWQRDRFVGHALFQHSHTMGIGSTAISRFPAIPDTVRVFHNAGMFQHTTGLCAVLEERGTVFVHCNGSAEAVLHHGNW